MPLPTTGSGTGTNVCHMSTPPEKTHLMCLRDKTIQPSIAMPQELSGVQQQQQPAVSPVNKEKPSPIDPRHLKPPTPSSSSSPLLKIAKMIEQAITKHNPLEQLKGALTDVLDVARR